MDENSKEYVVIQGRRYYIHENVLDLTGNTNFHISEIEGLDKLNN
ncbi:MAG: hypothetical protein ACFFCY_17475 [Promethearchaeota archaeon]